MGKRWVLYECPGCGRLWTLAEGERLPNHSQFAGGCTFQGVGLRVSFTLAEASRPGGVKTRIIKAGE